MGGEAVHGWGRDKIERERDKDCHCRVVVESSGQCNDGSDWPWGAWVATRLAGVPCGSANARRPFPSLYLTNKEEE